MKKIDVLFSVLVFFGSCHSPEIRDDHSQQEEKDPLITVATLDIRPGNVAVNKEGRIFTTVHPFGNPATASELIEITGPSSYEAFPNIEYQNTSEAASNDLFDTPLGIRIDNKNRLWIIDTGLNLGKTRLFAFDIKSRDEVFRFDLPEDVAPEGSFLQDLAVDELNGWIYMADIANPAIVALNINSKETRRFYDQSMNSENVDMIIDDKIIFFGGEPARVAINPITLSADRNTLYYGAMNGTTWYQLPAELFRNEVNDDSLRNSIKVKGPKPVSDGAATDKVGNTYFTNINHKGIDVLSTSGDLNPVIRDARIDWPDNVACDHLGNLFITVNQLHKSPAFTGGKDEGTPPYYIYQIALE
ncbi:MAG: L-dopachrome tautomerase-related protein [Bacteroidota bacterium]